MPLAVRRQSMINIAGQAPGSGTEQTLGRRHRPDYWLVVLMMMMLAVGLIVVYAISPALSQSAHTSPTHYISKQLIAISISIIAFVTTATVPLQTIKKFYIPLLVLAGIATLIALITPTNPLYPAHRWVRLGSFSFQSVELLKFGLLIWLAALLSERMRLGKITDIRHTLKPVAAAVVIIGIVVAGIQSDLGSAGVLVAIIGTMVFVAGMPVGRLLAGVSVIAIGVVLLISSTPYRRERLQTYLHPEQDCQAAGYQACQALIAIGSGGLTGLGLGRSVQAYGYLPEAANDSIFAIFAEKFGFIGVAALLAVMVAFFGRLKTIAERAPDNFSRLVVMGILAWLSLQAAINIGAMIGLLPLKGITLPFISYGGTSVVFAAASVGLAFQISAYTNMRTAVVNSGLSGRSGKNKGGQQHDANQDGSGDGRRQRGAYHPNPGGRARA